MKLLVPLVAVSLAVLAQPSWAQTKTHKWVDGMCEFSVRYDSRKVDAAALAGTTKLLSSEDGAVPLPPFMSTPADIGKHDPAAFERDCRAQADRLRSAAILPVPGLAELRAERVRQADDSCVFGTAYMKGYRDATVLRTYAPAAPHCDAFVDALEGKADMDALFRKSLADGCKDNASPNACRQRYESQASGPDGDAVKRLYLTNFGWGNCATRYTAVNVGSDQLTAMREKTLKVFRRTYRVKESCEQP